MDKIKVCNNIYVDKIYCINLEKDIDRKQIMKSLFKKFNILDKITWFNAIYNEKGYIGCRDSHINIIKQAYENNYKAILIFEDDATLKEFPFKLKNNIPDDWCMLYPGWLDIDMKSFKVSDELIRLKSARSTHCYIIRNNIIPYLLRMDKCRDSIDQIYWEVIQQTLPCYGLYPIRSVQFINNSSISGYSNKNLVDKMTQNAQIIYNEKNKFDDTNIWYSHYKTFMKIYLLKSKNKLSYNEIKKINF